MDTRRQNSITALLLAAILALGVPAYSAVTSFVGNTFYGLSSDTKPAVVEGSRFWESDTKKWYLRQGGNWVDWTPTGSGTPGDTVVSETAFGQSSAAGIDAAYSRGDHTHGTPGDPVPAHNVTASVHNFDASGNSPAQTHGMERHNAISHTSLTDKGTNTHAQIDTAMSSWAQEEKRFINIASTGYLSGGTISITAGQPAKFDMTAGTGVVVDNHTDPANPTLTPVSWPQRTSQTLTYLATADETAIGIDSSGNIVQQNTPFDETDWHDIIQIATIGHWSRSQIDYIIMEPLRATDVMTQLQGFWAAFGSFSMGGNEFTANGANMRLNKSGGSVFYQGGGSALTPNTISSSSGTAVYFSYYYESSPGVWVETALTQTIDDLKYNTGSGLGTVPVGKFTIQTIFFYAPLWVNGGSAEYSVDIQYGQVVYDTLAQAQAAITSSVRFNEYLAYDVFRTWLIVKRGTTSLQNAADALFIQAPPLKFGTMAATGGGSTGESNTASNVGTAGVGFYDSKVGVDLGFKNAEAASSKVSITDYPTNKTVRFDVTETNLAHTHSGGTGGGQVPYSSLSGLPTLPATTTCSGTDKVSAYNATTGAFTCTADQGGSGTFAITQTEIDFGATPVREAEFTITDATATSTSKIMASLAYAAPTGRAADEAQMEQFHIIAGQGAAGSFKLYVASLSGRVAGKYKLNYTLAN